MKHEGKSRVCISTSDECDANTTGGRLLDDLALSLSQEPAIQGSFYATSRKIYFPTTREQTCSERGYVSNMVIAKLRRRKY